jgi:hypothetical protein
VSSSAPQVCRGREYETGSVPSLPPPADRVHGARVVLGSRPRGRVGNSGGELLKTGCSAAVQVRSEEIARLRLRRGRRGITASAIRPAAGKMRRGFCAVSCRVSLCAGYLLRPSAARAFPAVSSSSAEGDPAGRVPRLRRRRPRPGVYTVDRG